MAPKLKVDRKLEAAEAAWLASPEGRRQTQKEFENALRRGELVRSGGAAIPRTDVAVLADLVEKAKARATKAISLRLPIADLERAKSIAAEEGTGYQTVLKRAIRAGLRKVS